MNIDNAKSQMRKGMLEYCVLLLLRRRASYASDIIQQLKEADLLVVEGTLYPLLSRLKNDGLLVSVPQRGKSMVFMSVPNPALPAGCLTADGQLARAFKYGRNAGYGSGATRPVPFTRERFGDAVFRNIARLLPHTAALLSAGEDAAGNAKREASGKTGRNSGTKPE